MRETKPKGRALNTYRVRVILEFVVEAHSSEHLEYVVENNVSTPLRLGPPVEKAILVRKSHET